MANSTATQTEAMHVEHVHHGEHVALPQHRHHFETEQQQREAGSLHSREQVQRLNA